MHLERRNNATKHLKDFFMIDKSFWYFNIEINYKIFASYLCFIILIKSSSDMLFFDSINRSMSLPAKYLSFGLALVTASSTILATNCR
jgi:hypothetical protein